jgi:hypothetical protein
LNQLTRADCTTRDPKRAERFARLQDELEDRIARLAEQENLDAMRPTLDGRQVMERLGVEPGPVVGEALAFLMDVRMERGEIATLSLEQACRAGAALGLALSVSAYPDGSPVRDAGQLRLESRLRVVIHREIGWQTEVPMPIPGDRRAWDVVLAAGGRRAGCECEQRLGDIQALERRLALKLRDGAVDVLILVVADTAWNRRVVREHREALRGLLRKLHGGTQHTGKVYLPPHPSETDRTARVVSLRRSLSRAVENEDFERAAALRDQIRRLEAGQEV